MRIKFQDNKGTQETLYYNPSFVLYGDGSIIAFPTMVWLYGKPSNVPMFVGSLKDEADIWCDPKQMIYNNDPLKNAAGAFRAMWKQDGIIYISRYKESKAESWWSRFKRRLNI